MPLARLDLVPGALDNGVAVDPTLTTQTLGSLTGTAPHGDANFYLEVDPTYTIGAWTGQLAGKFFQFNFNGLALPAIADMEAEYQFFNCQAACSNWANANNNWFGETIANGSFQFAVPEPASLGLLGTALLGMGLAWRRRQRR